MPSVLLGTARTQRKIAHIRFSIIVIADNTAEGKEEDGYGNEDRTSGTNYTLKRSLGEVDALQRSVGVETADENDECCAGANQEGVSKNAQCLNESLFDRMGDVGSSSYVRCTTLACFVAEETSFDAVHQGCT